MTSTTAPKVKNPKSFSAPRTPIGKTGKFFEERLQLSQNARKQLNKVFPDHWSFMMGEIALWSFIILLLTGTFLTFFFDASMAEVRYDGAYVPLNGVEMSRAYASTLDISFEVRGGLIMRQIHHWAALLFLAAMIIHMMRVFFTGGFRKPRELNWILGIGLITLGMVEGFAGYSLPDDLLSGTGLRIAHAIIESIPVVGTWVAYGVFGSKFPGTEIIPRLYIAHVLLIPGILLALIAAHFGLVVRQKHTDFAGPNKTESTVTGVRQYPVFALKGGGFFFIIFAVCAALGGLAQINPVWLFGPYNPAQVSAGSQPDWYIGFLDGSTRLFPSWEIRVWDHTIPALFWPTIVLPGILFTLAGAYPFLEAKLTKDHLPHNILQRPRDVPVRTALGAMSLAFYAVLLLSGGNDLIAKAFDISLNAMTYAGRVAMLLVPPLVYVVTYKICLGLQKHDREILEHGIETGIIKLLPNGEFIEIHQPLGPVDDHGHGQLQYAGAKVPHKMNELGDPHRRHKVLGFFFPVLEKPEVESEWASIETAHRDDHGIGAHADEEAAEGEAPKHALTD